MENLPNCLQHSYGEIVVSGTKLTLYHFLTDHLAGNSAEELATWYPSIPADLGRQVIAFYHARRPEVDRYMADYKATLDALYAATPKLDIEKMKARFRALYPERAAERWPDEAGAGKVKK